MLDIQVILLGDDLGISRKSVDFLLPDCEAVESNANGVVSIAREDGCPLIHVVSPGSLMLPGFYNAAITTLEHTKKDYVFCRCMAVDKVISTNRFEDILVFSQMVVRRWVLQELSDECSDLVELFDKVVSEYRGEEIPHVLCVSFANNGDNNE